MTKQHPRMQREAKTIRKMIALYCHDHHGTAGALCESCRELNEYAQLRLQKCPYQEYKSTCAKCLTHCYKPDQREAVRKVMAYAGPRMLTKHPWLAIMHLLDGLKKPLTLKEVKAKRGK